MSSFSTARRIRLDVISLGSIILAIKSEEIITMLQLIKMSFDVGVGDDETELFEQEPPVYLPLTGGDEPLQEKRPHVPLKVYLYTLCALVNSSNLGYDMGVNTSASKTLQESMNLTDVQLEIFIGSLAIFSMIGALVTSGINDRFGRRGGFAACNLFCLLGMGTDAVARNYFELMIGKLFIGVGVGIGLATNPTYIAELAPPEYRGFFVTWSDIGLNFGMMLGYVAGFVKLGTKSGMEQNMVWRYMFGLGMVPPGIILILVTFVVVESPRWLVQKNRIEDATSVLEHLYGKDYDADREITLIRQNIAKEMAANDAVSWKSLLCCPRPAIRRTLIVGVGIAIAHDAIGIAAIQYYLTNILEEAGLSEHEFQTYILIILGSLKVAFGCVAAFLFDARGRRQILFISLSGCTLSSILIAISYFKGLRVEYVICGLLIYLSSYSFGMGPGAWVVASEIFPLAIRAKGMGLAIFLNRGTAAFSTSIFLSLVSWIGYSGFFVMTAIQCFVALIFVYVYVPETKGISLEDMAVYFADVTRNPSFLNLMGDPPPQETTLQAAFLSDLPESERLII